MKSQVMMTVLFCGLVGLRSIAAADDGVTVKAVRLLSLDGRALTMTNFSERPLTVIVAMSARCPATERAVNELSRLQGTGKYRLRNVLFVGLFSNPDETGGEIREFCQIKHVGFPTYRDDAKATARRFGFHATPEVVVLDNAGKLVFRTGVDGADGLKALEAAMVAMLAGRTIEAKAVAANGTPLDTPAPKRDLQATAIPISFRSEFVYDKIAGAPTSHCSTICEMADGELICVWYGGSYESADDQTLYLSRRLPTGCQWSVPEVVIADPVKPPGNAVVFRDGRDRLWLVWGRMESTRPIRPGGGWGKCRLLARHSTDRGKTWSPDRVIDSEFWTLPRNPPIYTANDEILLPLSGNRDTGTGTDCFFLATADNGETWRRSGLFQGGSQPTIVERKDGSLLAHLRHGGFIQQSESSDGGRTWTQAKPTTLKNPGSGISMAKLKSGRIVLIFNDSATARTPLAVATSTDDGRTWSRPLALESNPGEFSYPCVIQSADGKIHVTYTYQRTTIKHVEFNEAWLRN